MVHPQIHQPPHRTRDTPAQDDGFDLQVPASVPLFVLRNALNPPHEATTSIRRQQLLTRAPIIFDLLQARCCTRGAS